MYLVEFPQNVHNLLFGLSASLVTRRKEDSNLAAVHSWVWNANNVGLN
jgi:hypothetical protein